MHTAKIHRRKKGASDLEAYQIVIVGNRRLIYHRSTPSPRPQHARLSPSMSTPTPSFLLLLFRSRPHFHRTIPRGGDCTIRNQKIISLLVHRQSAPEIFVATALHRGSTIVPTEPSYTNFYQRYRRIDCSVRKQNFSIQLVAES